MERRPCPECSTPTECTAERYALCPACGWDGSPDPDARYWVLESEPADVDGPPSWFVMDTDVDDAVCYCDTEAEALAEAARLEVL
jgi:hypothetical protein